MASLLKKYPILTKAQSPFKQLSDIEKMVKKQRSRYSEFHPNPDADKSHIKYFTRHSATTNVPINVGSLEEMYDEMRAAVRTMPGINFVLGMQTDDGKYQVWKRPNQPCQGGEMRKYGITHDDCTRPEDPRPGDLTHPFPDGKPIAVGSRVDCLYKSYMHQIHPLSIYRRAYTTENNIEIVKDLGDKSVKGLIALNADLVDPTMMVHMLRDARSWKYNQEVIMPQVSWLLNKVGYNVCYSSTNYPDYERSHYHVNFDKFIKGGIEATKDLTGGSLGSRFDYNRPDIEDAYRGVMGTNISLYQIINEAVFEGKASNKSFDLNSKKDFEYVGKKLEQYFKTHGA